MGTFGFTAWIVALAIVLGAGGVARGEIGVGTMPAAQATQSPVSPNGRSADAIPKAARRIPSLSGVTPVEWGVLGLAAALLAALWWRDVIRPESFRRNGLRKTGELGPLVWLFGAIATFIIGQMGGALALVGLGVKLNEADTPGPRVQGLYAIVAYGMGLTAVGVLLSLFRRASPSAEGITPRWKDVARGALAFAIIMPIVMAASQATMLLAWAVERWYPEEVAHKTLQQIVNQPRNPWVWIMAAGAVVGAPIVEEFVYRVCLQGALVRTTKRVWPSIAMVSVLFALSHWGAVPWYAMITLGVLGLSIGVAYERTKGLLVPITIHVLFNVANIAMALWTK
jgi:membrane protease YdiL (CAAX protease family)